jgi:hypothetical protein
MRDQTEIAKRFDSVTGHTLVDYFILHLPVQLLVVDIIGLDRRPVPAPTEFCLRAVEAGLVEDGNICEFLGVDLAYGRRLLRGLCDGDYLGTDAFGQYLLLRRGKELLRQGGEASPSDRRMYVLWDPIQRVVLDRTLVYTKQRAGPDGLMAPVPNAFARPLTEELAVGDINKLRAASSSVGDLGASSFEVLRVTGIHKSFGRYRQSVALIFAGPDGEQTFRLAINGSIDNDLTATCAKIGLPKLIGVDRAMANKPGVQAVRKRYRELICGNGQGPNVASLVQRRSILLLNLRGVNSRLAEERVDSLLAKKIDYEIELNELEQELDRLPVVPVRCHEMEYYLFQALEKATRSITITTTNPSAAKIDGDVIKRLRSCLAQGVHISIYISDRIGENDPTLAIFDKLSRQGPLSVQFLQNDVRSVFEVEWDEGHVVFSNEPPFGQRRRPRTPREFSGFYVSDGQAVARYRAADLSFEPKDFLVRLRPVVSNLAGIVTPKRRARAVK